MYSAKQFNSIHQFSKVFSTIVQLDVDLQNKNSQDAQNIGQYNAQYANDTFSVIEKAYWKLYLQIYEHKLTQFQKKQIYLHLTSKNGKPLNLNSSSKNYQSQGSFGSKVPKWFLYKNYMKKQLQQMQQREPQQSQQQEQDQQENQQGIKPRRAKIQSSIKQQGQRSLLLGTSGADPYHLAIKLQSSSLTPLQTIYKFFRIKQMLQMSTDLLDVQTITTLYRHGNSFDRSNPQQIEEQKDKFRQKFRLYAELVLCYQQFGYGSRKAKKVCKQKLTGNIYQYAVMHIAKIVFKLLQKYVMYFLDKKAKYVQRSRLEKISYNTFNLPDFFTNQQKALFIKVLKIIFQVCSPLPDLSHQQIKELYNHFLNKMDEKQKNPQKFKNQYMLKLENPTFYNVPKNLRQKVKLQSDQRKRLGIRNTGRKSKVGKQLDQLKQYLAQQKSYKSKKQSIKIQIDQKQPSKIKTKQQSNRIKQQYYDNDQSDQDNQINSDQYQFGQDEESLQEESIIDSQEESDDVKNYFKKKKRQKQARLEKSMQLKQLENQQKNKSKSKNKSKHKHKHKR